MKKIFLIAAAICVLAGCQTSKLDRQRNHIAQKFERLSKKDAPTEDFYNLAFGFYNKHIEDSIGLEMFFEMTQYVVNPQEIVELYENAEDLVKSNFLVNREMERIKTAALTCAGCDYVEISGPDALDPGSNLSLSEILKDGKPVIVDFWASWCPGCRQEISNHLVEIAAEGKYNVLGVAIAEKSVEDTKKAMEELGVTWPVVFGGGRGCEVGTAYGVNLIPTFILISPEGKILARGYSVDEILK